MWLYAGAVEAAIRRDHRPAEAMDRATIWLERHYLVSRPFRLEAAGRFGHRATDFGMRTPRGDNSLP